MGINEGTYALGRNPSNRFEVRGHNFCVPCCILDSSNAAFSKPPHADDNACGFRLFEQASSLRKVIDIDRWRHELRIRLRLHRHQKLLGGWKLDRWRPGT